MSLLILHSCCIAQGRVLTRPEWRRGGPPAKLDKWLRLGSQHIETRTCDSTLPATWHTSTTARCSRALSVISPRRYTCAVLIFPIHSAVRCSTYFCLADVTDTLGSSCCSLPIAALQLHIVCQCGRIWVAARPLRSTLYYPSRPSYPALLLEQPFARVRKRAAK
nr:hypothetical protein CFP56_72390 [Quercus suber]